MTPEQRATLGLVLSEMDGTLHGRFYFASDAADALQAVLGTCGNCRHARTVPDPSFPGDTRLVCAHESEAHPLHWCRDVPESFGCNMWEAR